MLTPPPTIQNRTVPTATQLKTVAALTTPSFSVQDIGQLLLIGEPESGYRGVFEVRLGGSVIIGRPSNGHKHNAPLAYFPSRAVSRTHAVITMAEDGIYITHLRPTNLTWRAVDSIWTPMKVGERAKLTHKDILCFGTAPKSKSHGNRVDAPFIVSIAFVPVGDEVSWTKYKFVKKTIHRPYQHMTKQKEMDAGMQLLLNDLNGLNVSPGQVGTGEHEGDTPTASKRKRGAPSEPDAERSDESTIRHSRDPSRSEQSKFVTEDASKKRRLPGSSSSPYCEDAVDLPDTLTKMTLS